LLDKEKLKQLLSGRSFDGVIHFAALSIVGESTKKPGLYFQNNVTGTLNLVEAMLENNNRNLVFSSSAAIFGNPQSEFIGEEHPKEPINPYGRSKLMVEQMLQDICKASDLNACCFRYFNAAGADASCLIGEAHEPETHLIPNVLRSIQNAGPGLKIYGSDYKTHDGTCVRDYVHVNDLAAAHLLGLEYLNKHPGFSAFNLGNGNGFSVLEVLRVCSKVTGEEIPYGISGRRAGDPAQLVADSRKAELRLGWQPQWSDLESIVESAWSWHKQEKSK
jgi:UDP-glucose 4-epimerase